MMKKSGSQIRQEIFHNPFIKTDVERLQL